MGVWVGVIVWYDSWPLAVWRVGGWVGGSTALVWVGVGWRCSVGGEVGGVSWRGGGFGGLGVGRLVLTFLIYVGIGGGGGGYGGEVIFFLGFFFRIEHDRLLFWVGLRQVSL